jgi:DNA-binding protein Fis
MSIPTISSSTSATDYSIKKYYSVREAVEQATEKYVDAQKNCVVENLYHFMLEEIEIPLLTFFLEKFNGNQSKVAKTLGLFLGTARKLLFKYDILHK